MAKREILAGATDQTIDIFVNDSSSTVGAGLTGLVFNTAGLTCYYRKGATGTPTALTLATQTVGGAHSDGGFVALDATNMPGAYRLDLSDTIVATAGMVTLYLRGATNMVPCVLEIEVVSVNKFDSVRMGLTALPNAAADAAGGLPISDAGGLDLDAKIGALTYGTANRVNVQVYGMEAGTVTAAAVATGAIDADAVAADAVTEIQSGLATASALTTLTNIFTGITSLAQWLGLIAGKQTGNSTARTEIRATGAGSGTYDETTDSLEAVRDNTGTAGAGLTAIDLPDQTMNITGNLSGSVGSVTGTVGSVTGNVGGNVTGSVGSIATGGITSTSFAAGAIDAAAIAADAIGSSELAASAVSEIWTTALTESYNADGAAPTPAQALFLIMQMLTEMSISGTTMTIKKLDGSTTALTLTLNSATTPTSVTRAT